MNYGKVRRNSENELFFSNISGACHVLVSGQAVCYSPYINVVLEIQPKMIFQATSYEFYGSFPIRKFTDKPIKIFSNYSPQFSTTYFVIYTGLTFEKLWRKCCHQSNDYITFISFLLSGELQKPISFMTISFTM